MHTRRSVVVALGVTLAGCAGGEAGETPSESTPRTTRRESGDDGRSTREASTPMEPVDVPPRNRFYVLWSPADGEATVGLKCHGDTWERGTETAALTVRIDGEAVSEWVSPSDRSALPLRDGDTVTAPATQGSTVEVVWVPKHRDGTGYVVREETIPTHPGVPSVVFEYEWRPATGKLTVHHARGDAFTAENTTFLMVDPVERRDRTYMWATTEGRGAQELPVETGGSVTVPASSGERFEITWTWRDDDGKVVNERLDAYRVP
ncbi:MAG: hypothetical protein ABEJ06_06595 [Haloarculaceae archaeon]